MIHEHGDGSMNIVVYTVQLEKREGEQRRIACLMLEGYTHAIGFV